MKAYLAILKTRIRALFQYRAAAFAGLVTQVFWGIIKVMIFTAFFAQATSAPPISLAQTLTFVWLGQALLLLIPWNVDKEIEASIKNGDVAYELVRPMDLYWVWFYRSLAMRIMPTLLRSIPVFIIAGLFFHLPPPASLFSALSFGLSLILAALLSSAFTTLVIISLFWTISGEGIRKLLPHFVLFFSGLIVPLPLFPSWFQPFLNLQPARGVIDIPCRLYTGIISENEAWLYLGFQLAWIFLLILSGKYLIKTALKRFVIQGG